MMDVADVVEKKLVVTVDCALALGLLELAAAKAVVVADRHPQLGRLFGLRCRSDWTEGLALETDILKLATVDLVRSTQGVRAVGKTGIGRRPRLCFWQRTCSGKTISSSCAF